MRALCLEPSPTQQPPAARLLLPPPAPPPRQLLTALRVTDGIDGAWLQLLAATDAADARLWLVLRLGPICQLALPKGAPGSKKLPVLTR